MIRPSQAIKSLRPTASFCIEDGVLTWFSTDITQPTEAEINAEVARLQAEYDAKQYQRNRAEEYPSLQEQLDMQYWDSVNGTTVWQDTINAIKAKYPKVG